MGLATEFKSRYLGQQSFPTMSSGLRSSQQTAWRCDGALRRRCCRIRRSIRTSSAQQAESLLRRGPDQSSSPLFRIADKLLAPPPCNVAEHQFSATTAPSMGPRYGSQYEQEFVQSTLLIVRAKSVPHQWYGASCRVDRSRLQFDGPVLGIYFTSIKCRRSAIKSRTCRMRGAYFA